MKGRELTGVTQRELDRRGFLKAVGAATVLGAAGVLGGNLLLGCAPTKSPKAGVPAGYESIRIVGGSLGGTSATATMAFSSVLSRHYPEISWSSSSGATTTNVIYTAKGTIKLASVTPSSYMDAYGFDKIPESRLRSVMMLYAPTQYVWLIREDKPWKDLSEVPKGSTLSPGPPGGTALILADAWLEVYGLSKKDFNWIPLGRTEVGDAWRAGKLDAALFGISGPAPALVEMYNSPYKYKAMGLSPEYVAKAKAQRTFERVGFSEPRKSNLTELVAELFREDVFCAQQTNFLTSRDDFPEDIAYRMAKIFDEYHADLVRIYAALKYATPQHHIEWAGPPSDIHSGVAQYYKEKGYLK